MNGRTRTRSWISVLGICLLAFAGTYLLAMAPFRAPAMQDETATELASLLPLPRSAAQSAQADAAAPWAGPAPAAPSPGISDAHPLPDPTADRCLYDLPTLFDAIDSNPNLTHDLKQAAVALQAEDWVAALDLLEPWLDAEEMGAGLHFIAGSALLGIGETSESRQHLETAAWMAPDQIGVWVELARAHLAAGAPKYAYRAARRALQISTEDHRAHFVRGRALLELKRGDEALVAFARAAKICATDPDVWNAIGLIWLYRSKPEQARDALETAVACDDPPAYAHNNLGIVYEQLGLYEWAEREYARCLDLDPAHPTAAQSRRRVVPFMAVRPWVGQSRSR